MLSEILARELKALGCRELFSDYPQYRKFTHRYRKESFYWIRNGQIWSGSRPDTAIKFTDRMIDALADQARRAQVAA